jgi:hypothetical protein
MARTSELELLIYSCSIGEIPMSDRPRGFSDLFPDDYRDEPVAIISRNPASKSMEAGRGLVGELRLPAATDTARSAAVAGRPTSKSASSSTSAQSQPASNEHNGRPSHRPQGRWYETICARQASNPRWPVMCFYRPLGVYIQKGADRRILYIVTSDSRYSG